MGEEEITQNPLSSVTARTDRAPGGNAFTVIAVGVLTLFRR